jgi:hypothetical protein
LSVSHLAHTAACVAAVVSHPRSPPASLVCPSWCRGLAAPRRSELELGQRATNRREREGERPADPTRVGRQGAGGADIGLGRIARSRVLVSVLCHPRRSCHLHLAGTGHRAEDRARVSRCSVMAVAHVSTFRCLTCCSQSDTKSPQPQDRLWRSACRPVTPRSPVVAVAVWCLCVELVDVFLSRVDRSRPAAVVAYEDLNFGHERRQEREKRERERERERATDLSTCGAEGVSVVA